MPVAAVWGNDIGDGMLYGAAGGAVFSTLTSENLSNWTNGEGFYTNENVFNSMMERGMEKQAMLDYFGLKGDYNPDNPMFKGGNDPGITDPKTGKIFYNDKAFSSYDNLKFTADHELRHRHDILSGKYKDINLTTKLMANEEFYTYTYNYRRQGLYPNHTMNLSARLNAYGTRAGINIDEIFKYDSFDRSWWHFIYKIPRRW